MHIKMKWKGENDSVCNKKSQTKKLRKIAQKIVVQSPFHKTNIIKYYRIMVDEARLEFAEDDVLSLNHFLKECFDEALKNNV